MDVTARRSRRAGKVARLSVVVVALALCGCSGDGGGGNPLATRGRQVYLAQCTACHAADPGSAGPVGPAVRGASRDLLDAKLVRGTYPPGYTPKRPTQVMPPQPQLATEISALAEFLK